MTKTVTTPSTSSRRPEAIINSPRLLTLLVEFVNCNPQGDPDRENAPRIDTETGHGLISAPGLNRQVRDTWARDGKEIQIARGASLDSSGKEKEKDVCKRYIDARVFGSFQHRGAIHTSMGRSVSAISVMTHATTRVAGHSARKETEEDKDKAMGSTHFIPYGLYRFEIRVDPHRAQETGVTEQDYQDYINGLLRAYQERTSSTRNQVAIRGLYELEFAPGTNMKQNLLENLLVEKKAGVDYPRSFQDYDVRIPTQFLKATIEHDKYCFRRLDAEPTIWEY